MATSSRRFAPAIRPRRAPPPRPRRPATRRRRAPGEWQALRRGAPPPRRRGALRAAGSTADRGLHLDLLSLEPAPADRRRPLAARRVRAMGGARRTRPGDRARREDDAPHGRARSRFRQLAFAFLDAQEALRRDDRAGGALPEPPDPERFVEDFPPGVLFGTGTWTRSPARRRAWRLRSRSRRAARAGRPSRRRAPRAAVPGAWKIAAGEAYQAETREARPA